MLGLSLETDNDARIYVWLVKESNGVSSFKIRVLGAQFYVVEHCLWELPF